MTKHHPPPAFADTTRERIAEIGEILALGLVRLRARQSSQIADACGDSSLACVASQSGGANSQTENAE